MAVFFALMFFCQQIHQELFHCLQDWVFISFGISKFYVMLSPTSQSYPEFHSFFNKEKTSAETATKLDIISSIWDDDHIRRVDEKNWQCLWCNQIFQGINATKVIAHVLGKKGMHIKICHVDKDKSHTTRYQELQNYKQAPKGVIHDYSENIRASITSLFLLISVKLPSCRIPQANILQHFIHISIRKRQVQKPQLS